MSLTLQWLDFCLRAHEEFSFKNSSVLFDIFFFFLKKASAVAQTVKNLPRLNARLKRSPREENGYPLQCSSLGNPMDRRAWWATVHGIAKSWTRLQAYTPVS